MIRKGYRLIGYDARGLGPPPPRRAEYADLVGDLEAVLAHLELGRVALVGSSMGRHRDGVHARAPGAGAGACPDHPAYTGYARTGDVDGDTWERMASELDAGGVDAFVEVAQPGDLPEKWREIAHKATRQRMERHENPRAVAQALREVPRSIAWKGLEPLSALDVPVLVVGSRDEADTLHLLGVAERYVAKLPRAELAVEDKRLLAAGLAGRAPVGRDRGGLLPAGRLRAVVEDAPEAHDRRAPPPPPPRSPGSCPSRSRSSSCSAASSASRAK